MLRHKLQILLDGAHKHRNRQLIDELAPLRDRWQAETEVSVSC